MLELLWLLPATLPARAHTRHDGILENLLLRHQLAVLTRPTRTRPRAWLHAWDKVLWIVARRFCAGWRERHRRRGRHAEGHTALMARVPAENR